MLAERATAAFSTALAALLAVGCSALINPDAERVGGEDAGDSAIDAAFSDAGRRDSGLEPDSAVDSGARDSGSRDAGASDGGVRDGGAPDAGLPDGGPRCPESCDDGVACTADACDPEVGVCSHTPDPSACDPGERCSASTGCVPERCALNEDCDDGFFCNGAEVCDPTAPGSGCVAGPAPTCDDGASCTADRCDRTRDECVNTPRHADCADGVACTIDSCRPESAADPSGCVRTPSDTLCDTDYCRVGRTCDPSSGCTDGAPRVCTDGTPCTADSCDSVGRACVFTPRDEDGDMAPAASVTVGGPTFLCEGGTDCDDGDANVHPGASEACNGRDDDCDDTVDEGCPALPDTCLTASEILLDSSGRGSAQGRLRDLSDDYQLPNNALCSPGRNGRDAVYSVRLGEGTWDLRVDTVGSAVDTLLGVGTSCGPNGPSDTCNDDVGDFSSGQGGRVSRVWLHGITAGPGGTTVYILVDGFNGMERGDYVVNVQRTRAAAETCGAGLLDLTGGGTVMGFVPSGPSIGGAHQGTCVPADVLSPETIFRVDVPGGERFEALAFSREFVPDLFVRAPPCANGTEVACDAGQAVPGGNAAEVEVGPRGGDARYFVFIEVEPGDPDTEYHLVSRSMP